MGNNALHDLAKRLRSRRIDRRQFLQGAAALGASATAISSALRLAPARAQGATNVTFWTTHSDPTDLQALNQIVADFNTANPDTQVELVQRPPQQTATDVSNLITSVRGGEGPDSYLFDRFSVAQWAAEGLLEDLSQFLDGQDLSEQYIPFAWQEANFDGKPYGLPFDTDARAIYYNRGLIQAAGIDPAELDAANGPVTFARFGEIALAMNTMEGDNYTQMGFVPWFDQGWHYGYGYSFGGEFFNEAECEVTPDHEGVVAGFQWVYDFAAQLDPTKAEAFIAAAKRPGAPPSEHPFVQGRLGMVVTGDWQIARMPQYAPDIDYGITYMPVPAEGDESVTWAGGWSVVVPVNAKNPEGGFAFTQYMTGEAGQRVYTEVTKHLPTIQALLEDPSLYDERHRFFSEQLLPTAKNRPPLPVGSLYWDELTAAWEKTYLNQEEPQPALAEAKSRVQPRIEQYCPITISQ